LKKIYIIIIIYNFTHVLKNIKKSYIKYIYIYMENIIINIDSRYRNTNLFTNTKFKYELMKTYKNIISIRLLSFDHKFDYPDDYIFLKINDWGNINFNNENDVVFAKIIILNNYTQKNIDFINSEYKFKQPINIQKIDIELVNYLGNNININQDYSFTLEITSIYNSDLKSDIETNYLTIKK